MVAQPCRWKASVPSRPLESTPAFIPSALLANSVAASDPTAPPDVLHPPLPFATAQCRDAWFSYSQTREGTCAGHGGVLVWMVEPGTAYAVLAERQQQASGFLGNGFIGSASISFSGNEPPAGCVSISGGACITLRIDGSWSSSTGSGTCSSHGGEAALHPYTGGQVPGCGSRGGPGYRLPSGKCALAPAAPSA